MSANEMVLECGMMQSITSPLKVGELQFLLFNISDDLRPSHLSLLPHPGTGGHSRLLVLQLNITLSVLLKVLEL